MNKKIISIIKVAILLSFTVYNSIFASHILDNFGHRILHCKNHDEFGIRSDSGFTVKINNYYGGSAIQGYNIYGGPVEYYFLCWDRSSPLGYPNDSSNDAVDCSDFLEPLNQSQIYRFLVESGTNSYIWYVKLEWNDTIVNINGSIWKQSSTTNVIDTNIPNTVGWKPPSVTTFSANTSSISWDHDWDNVEELQYRVYYRFETSDNFVLLNIFDKDTTSFTPEKSGYYKVVAYLDQVESDPSNVEHVCFENQNPSGTVMSGNDYSYKASNLIENTSPFIIQSGGEATLKASEVKLKPGFEAKEGSEFKAEVDPCQ